MRKILSSLFLFLIICSSHAFAQTADIYQKAGDGYFDDKNYQAAFDSYNHAIKKSDGDKAILSVLYYKRGKSLYGLHKTDEAIQDYNSAIAINPSYMVAYWDRGVVYDHTSRFQLAIDDYKKAISLINDNSQSISLSVLYCNIAYNELSLNNLDEALKADSTSLALNEFYSRGYKARGQIHTTLKNYALAVDDYTLALENYRDNDTSQISSLLTMRADNKRYLKKYKDAINDYSMAIRLFSQNRFAYWNRAAAYGDNGDYKLASDDYTTAINYYKGDSTNLSKLYIDRANNEIGQSLLNNAIMDDSVALTYNTDDAEAYYSRAIAYTQSGDYQLGINDYNKLITLKPNEKKLLAILYYQVANNEYFLNEFDKVITDCSKAIELNPEYSASYYYRAKVYLKQMQNKQLAVNDFNKVMQLDTTKKSVSYIFSLYYTGKPDEAIVILQNDVLNTNNDASLLSDYYNLACLYSLMNKPDEANTYLKKAVDNGYSKKYAAADSDLDNIRNTDDYKSIIAGPSN